MKEYLNKAKIYSSEIIFSKLVADKSPDHCTQREDHEMDNLFSNKDHQTLII